MIFPDGSARFREANRLSGQTEPGKERGKQIEKPDYDIVV
ncbi:hypothetical protein B4096_0428 [Heyndrickxia coagulans]|nr:hypothetical protein B4100_0471 [Heyndrickxia coagulans]KYC73130.1 hypothetical protein B4096_0428 [Heyndrickxia coagulans]